MTGFRQICRCICLLLLGAILSAPVLAVEQTLLANKRIQQLEQENSTLQRKVRRLERQTKAMRDELNSPGAPQIIGGIGYIVGLFGVAGWIAARKKSRQEK